MVNPRVFLAAALLASLSPSIVAQPGPTLTDKNLSLRTVASGFVTPIAMAFIGPDDFFLLEKNTGRVLRVTNGVTAGVVLDLNVNFASERGLLGIALHPEFSDNGFVYLFWSEPLGGADTDEVLAVPLLGNRVDRFVWNGSTLTFDRNIIELRSLQDDFTNPAPRANHDGGVLAFGPDGKLYIMFGDVGRRGLLQNNMMGPVPDDQFGGPEPDDAHYSGVIIRLNDDGTTPTDNPFFGVTIGMGAEADANIHKTFVYGIRNSFGMAFDPKSGRLWYQENGEDAFDEVNIAVPGMNSGWIQIAGPVSRVAEYKEIETTSLHHEDFPNLQQLRWPPELIADTPAGALARLFEVPGSRYVDPVLSWKFVIAPAAIGFVEGKGLGAQYNGDLIMGLSTTDSLGGPLMSFNLSGNRRKIVGHGDFGDGVVDNETFHDLGTSERNVIGTDFGIITDIKMGPNGLLYVVSLDQGAIYEISRRQRGRRP